MMHAVTLTRLDEQTLARLADDIAFAMAPGDVIALSGDLGAGKTTMARAILRALAGDDHLDVPSPTFTLEQSYQLPRFAVTHADLYRIEDPREIDELSIGAALENGAVLIEWPERGGDFGGTARLDIELAETGDADTRNVTLRATGALADRLMRLEQIRAFVSRSGWGGADVRMAYLQGDASPRRYARLTSSDGQTAILMDWPHQPDGPPIRDGLPYSRIAHLAESVHAFVAIAHVLDAGGLRPPAIFAQDLDHGLLLIEDLGDAVFTSEIDRNTPQVPLWRRATDVLIAMRGIEAPDSIPIGNGGRHTLHDIDRSLMEIEVALLADWYWPAAFGQVIPDDVRAGFNRAWSPLFERVLAAPRQVMLRDYHSPNLIALGDDASPRDIGIIDFQDAIRGPLAYDLVSLLQDARRDCDADLERDLLGRYIDAAAAADATFNRDDFIAVYAILGAQRATKILGIFARLAKRDGKPQYLQHVPRIWGYLERNLAHPALQELRDWYDTHLNQSVRRRPLVT